MYLDPAVVFDEAELPKAIHKETNARPGGPNHLRQSFLGDLRDHTFWFAGLAEFRHQEKNPGQTLFTGVEKLIDQIRLRTHAAGEEKLEEQIREGMFLVHHSDHLHPLNLERGTGANGCRCRQPKSHGSGERFFSHKVAGREQGNGSFFSCSGNDGQLGPSLLQVKDRVRLASLRKEALVCL